MQTQTNKIKKKLSKISYIIIRSFARRCEHSRQIVEEYVEYQSGGNLQCVAVCCSVLQCVEVCCSVSQCVAVCWWQIVEEYVEYQGGGNIQCVAVCCSVLQCVAVCLQCVGGKQLKSTLNITCRQSTVCCRVLQCVAVCCSVLQCAAVCCKSAAVCCKGVAVCCRVLPCVAVCWWQIVEDVEYQSGCVLHNMKLLTIHIYIYI